MPPPSTAPATTACVSSPTSVLAWPAWLRVLAVLPSLAMLWLAVAWASVEAVPL